jgi:hypothetical protein
VGARNDVSVLEEGDGFASWLFSSSSTCVNGAPLSGCCGIFRFGFLLENFKLFFT